MNTVSRFWKNFVAEEISYGNAIAVAPGNVAVAIPASGKRNYKDLVFRKIFHDKEKLLSLYNALNHSHYEDPELLPITTLENAVYLSLQNDLSFVVDFDLWFFEHQSTLNPNMPYRFLLYLASEYSKLNTDDLLYSNKLQMLDTPHFVVFYNGTDPLPEYSTLKLSSAYRRPARDSHRRATAPILSLRSASGSLRPRARSQEDRFEAAPTHLYGAEICQ